MKLNNQISFKYTRIKEQNSYIVRCQEAWELRQWSAQHFGETSNHLLFYWTLSLKHANSPSLQFGFSKVSKLPDSSYKDSNPQTEDKGKGFCRHRTNLMQLVIKLWAKRNFHFLKQYKTAENKLWLIHRANIALLD